ncbi:MULTISPECIES: hypothetical protein [unclassified Desulfovibrio]|uniref:hypothetical protein n=1 Tax=unclassified Desulfovibrio TaxID=2593640 RepID=UPI0013EAF63B|nr:MULTISPECIES: hypothetical protein [unclassified Desulfovibrio]
MKEWAREKNRDNTPGGSVAGREATPLTGKGTKGGDSAKEKDTCGIISPVLCRRREVAISIPVGRSIFAERVFNAFSATGREVTLPGVALSENTLRAVEADGAASRLHRPESGAARFPNALLSRSGAMCALCGERVCASEKEPLEAGVESGDAEEIFRLHSSGALPVCQKCLHRFDLEIAHAGKPVALQPACVPGLQRLPACPGMPRRGRRGGSTPFRETLSMVAIHASGMHITACWGKMFWAAGEHYKQDRPFHHGAESGLKRGRP